MEYVKTVLINQCNNMLPLKRGYFFQKSKDSINNNRVFLIQFFNEEIKIRIIRTEYKSWLKVRKCNYLRYFTNSLSSHA